MSAPEDALRAALTANLSANPDVGAVLGMPARLLETVSADAAYPYASWGRVETRNRDAETLELIECRMTLDVWCRDQHPSEVTGVLRTAIAEAEIQLADPWTLIALAPVYCDVFSTRDRRVRRGLVRLRAVVSRLLDA